MARKTGIGLLLVGALILSVGWIAATAGAEESSQAVLPSEVPPLPVVSGPSGEPASVESAAEGTVESAAGTVTEAAATVTGGGAPPQAAGGETDPAPGGHERGGTVGKALTGTTEAVGDATASAEGVAKSTTGDASPPPEAESGTTGQAGAEAPAPAPTTASPAPVGSPSVTASADDLPTSGSPRGSAATHRRVESPAVGDSVAELRRIAGAIDPAASTGAAIAGTVKTLSEGADGALGALPTSPSKAGSSGSATTERDRDASSGGSFRLSDLTPLGGLGTLAFVLILGAAALAVTLVVRRELGLGFLPGRRLRG